MGHEAWARVLALALAPALSRLTRDAMESIGMQRDAMAGFEWRGWAPAPNGGQPDEWVHAAIDAHGVMTHHRSLSVHLAGMRRNLRAWRCSTLHQIRQPLRLTRPRLHTRNAHIHTHP